MIDKRVVVRRFRVVFRRFRVFVRRFRASDVRSSNIRFTPHFPQASRAAPRGVSGRRSEEELRDERAVDARGDGVLPGASTNPRTSPRHTYPTRPADAPFRSRTQSHGRYAPSSPAAISRPHDAHPSVNSADAVASGVARGGARRLRRLRRSRSLHISDISCLRRSLPISFATSSRGQKRRSPLLDPLAGSFTHATRATTSRSAASPGRLSSKIARREARAPVSRQRTPGDHLRRAFVALLQNTPRGDRRALLAKSRVRRDQAVSPGGESTPHEKISKFHHPSLRLRQRASRLRRGRRGEDRLDARPVSLRDPERRARGGAHRVDAHASRSGRDSRDAHDPAEKMRDGILGQVLDGGVRGNPSGWVRGSQSSLGGIRDRAKERLARARGPSRESRGAGGASRVETSRDAFGDRGTRATATRVVRIAEDVAGGGEDGEARAPSSGRLGSLGVGVPSRAESAGVDDVADACGWIGERWGPVGEDERAEILGGANNSGRGAHRRPPRRACARGPRGVRRTYRPRG